MITYERSSKLRKLLEQLPLESIVLETDAPDMTVQQYKGQRNSPHYLPYILDSVAQIKQTSKTNIANACTANLKRIFGTRFAVN